MRRENFKYIYLYCDEAEHDIGGLSQWMTGAVFKKTRGANKSYREKLCGIKNALCWGRVFQKVQAKKSAEAPAAAAAKSPLPAAAPDSDSDWGDWKAQ